MVGGIAQACLGEHPGLDVDPGVQDDVVAALDEVELLAEGVWCLVEEDGDVDVAVRAVVPPGPGAEEVERTQVRCRTWPRGSP